MATPHISAEKGDFAKTVLMPGDPLRAKFIADTFLKDVRHWKIAGGLQVSYTKLIDEQIDAPLLIRKEESVIAEYDGYRAYHYNTANPARDFEFFNGELDAHKEYTSEGHGMNTHEYLLVTRGEMVLRYGGEEYLLREGDFIHFDCTQPHTYCNRGESMTEFTNIVYYIG